MQRAINLTPAQIEDCIALRVCYLQKLAQVLKRRKQITARLAWVEDHSLSHTGRELRSRYVSCRYTNVKPHTNFPHTAVTRRQMPHGLSRTTLFAGGLPPLCLPYTEHDSFLSAGDVSVLH